MICVSDIQSVRYTYIVYIECLNNQPRRSAAHINKINKDFQKGVRPKKVKDKKEEQEEGGLNPYIVAFLMFVVIGSGLHLLFVNVL